MPLPAILTFNELDGSEVAHILANRFGQVLERVPYFQRHLTLPRVRMTMQVTLEIWADQPSPETHVISDRLEVVTSEPVADEATDVITAESVDSTAPGPGGGRVPDQIRERHGLPIPAPERGSRAVGGQIATADVYAGGLEGREVEGLPGLKISRTGSGEIDGMAAPTNATVAKIDQGPAGLRAGAMNRDAWQFGGKK